MDSKNNAKNDDPAVESPTSVLEDEVSVILYCSCSIFVCDFL